MTKRSVTSHGAVPPKVSVIHGRHGAITVLCAMHKKQMQTQKTFGIDTTRYIKIHLGDFRGAFDV